MNRTVQMGLLIAMALLSGLVIGSALASDERAGLPSGDTAAMLGLTAVGGTVLAAGARWRAAAPRIPRSRQRREEELARLQAQFIQTVAHELRTPLALVQGCVELLAEEQLDEETRQQLVSLAKARTAVLVERVEAITTLQELEEGRLNPERVDMMELTRTALKMMWQKAHRASVALCLEGPVDLPSVVGDPARLLEALRQMLDNAIKFSPEGGAVCVRLYATEDEVRVEVADQGIGIPPDQLERVFDRFYQVDGSTTRRFGGMGLGLAIVRAVAEAHDGWVQAASEGPGKGSTFTLALPTRPAGHIAPYPTLGRDTSR